MTCTHCARPLFMAEEGNGVCVVCKIAATERFGRLFALGSLTAPRLRMVNMVGAITIPPKARTA